VTDLVWGLVLNRMASWQRLTFPRTTTVGAANHLRKEIEELTDKPDDAEEWADVLHLAIQGGCKAAGSLNNFLQVVGNKLDENTKKRKWPAAPDAEGVYEHKRG
jgi:hypothetical protein